MFVRYRHVLSVPGALRFSASALVGRLPMGMVTIGIVLLVTGVGRSYGLAGAMSAAYLIATAALAIPQARLVDRLGQGPVLTVAAAAFAVAMCVFVVIVQSDGPEWSAFAAVMVAGCAFPQVGSCVRSRWSHVLRQRVDIDTAYALESAIDEVVFVSGPILVTVLATAWDPVAGLATAVVAGTGGTLFFAAQRSTAPVPTPRVPGIRPARLPLAVMGPVCVVGLALGTLFGAAEVSTVAFASTRGLEGYAGLLLALWAAGSLIAGVVTGAVAWQIGPAARLRRGSLAMFVAMVPLSVIDSMWVMGAWLFVAGFAIAPTLIATLSLVEQAVPRSRLTEGMAVVETALVAGVAPGAALAGWIIDGHGASTAYLVSLVAGLVAAVTAFACRDEVATFSGRSPRARH
ncbi:MAG TPA: MFS transporter [Nocardioides sp.]|jgi:MFS family permease|nr:MFS transporter [Nocardioides sp.]